MRAFQENAFQEHAFQIKWKIKKAIHKISAYFGAAFLSAHHGEALLKNDSGKSDISAAN